MSRPALIVTGASGFVGRHLLEELKDEYRIFAIARRSQRECGAPVHPNIAWMQVDIGDSEGLARTFREIASAGGARVLLHLAAYYDYAGEHRPEYRRTNVEGTQHVLELAQGLQLERFVFASSVAACEFPRREGPIDRVDPAGRPPHLRVEQAGGRAPGARAAGLGSDLHRALRRGLQRLVRVPSAVRVSEHVARPVVAVADPCGPGRERHPLHPHPGHRHVHQAPARPARSPAAGERF